MYMTLIDVLLIIGMSQSVFFALFLLLSPKRRQLSNRLLACVLLSLACSQGNFLLFSTGVVGQFPRFAYLGNTLGLFALPFFYCYVHALKEPQVLLRKYRLSFVPVVLILGVVLTQYTFKDTAIQLRIIQGVDRKLIMNSPLVPALVFLLGSTYLALIFVAIRRFDFQLKMLYTDVTRRDLRWVFHLFLGFLSLMLISLGAQVLSPESGQLVVWQYAQALNILCFVGYFIYKGWHQPDLFDGLMLTIAPKYGVFRLEESEKQKFLKQLEHAMQQKRPYLREDLNLEQLAESCSMTARELSQLINSYYHQNFHDFINGYRIEVACQILADSQRSLPILEIIAETGFRSKSAFYAAFKKRTGMTPTNYKKQASLESQSAVHSV